MSYNFDEIVDRKNTNSIKYDFALERGKPLDVLPLWVADMDFKAPPAVIEALTKAAQHGVFGYTEIKQDYFEAIKRWYQSRFNWDIKESWLVKTPGVVYAISTAIRALTNEEDAIIIQRPVYYPFSDSIIVNQRKLINNPLIYKEGVYYIDFKDFEEKIIENNVKMFIFCSPHNPVGRVWTQQELLRLGDICIKHGVIVVSDEIHADFVYNRNRHFVFTSLKEEYLENTIICTAPSKTFNLAGLQVSNIFIANKDMREKFKQEIKKSGYSQLNTMGLIGCQVAYEQGERWLEDLKDYIEGNLGFIRDFLAERLPQIQLVEPQGTYLVWLDFKGLKCNEEELEDLIANKANLWLSNGVTFGIEGFGFQRVNIACPRSMLERAFLQLEKAINED